MKITAVYKVWLTTEIPDDSDLPPANGEIAGDIWNEIISCRCPEWEYLPGPYEIDCVYKTDTEKTLWE